MLEFPKMLFRKGEEIVWEGRQLATRIVNDAESEARAIEDGWRSLETLLAGEVAKVKKAVKK